MKLSFLLALGLALVALTDAQTYNKCGYKFKIFSDTGKNRGGIRKTVRAFEKALGGVNNADDEPGPLDSGRRAINWDAAGVPFDMPFNFFDKTVKRGAVFIAKKKEFRVSNPAPGDLPVDNRFDSILPKSITRQFRTFSPFRLFTPFEKNAVTQIFKIPAKNQRASTSGFGAVFTDVDLKGKTYIDFKTKSGCLLWRLPIEPQSKGLSFGALYIIGGFPAIYKVDIKLGTISVKDAAKSSYKPSRDDVVVLDDLIYGEPM